MGQRAVGQLPPPEFLRLAGHALRWRLLGERAFQRTAAEVATRVGFLLALIQHDSPPGRHAPPPGQKVH